MGGRIKIRPPVGGQQPAAAYRSASLVRRKKSLSGSCRHSMKKQKRKSPLC